MTQFNLIIGAIAITLLFLVRMALVGISTLLRWFAWIPISVMCLIGKLDLSIGGIMQNIANLLNLQDHDQN